MTVPNRTPLVVGTFEALRLTSGGVARVDPAPGFADPDGDSLIFEATSSDLDVARAWVSLGQVLVRAVGKGTATVTVAGRDSEGLRASQEFNVRVQGPKVSNPNEAPFAVGALVDQNLEVGDTRTLTVASYFADPDEDDLLFAAESSNDSVAAAAARGSEVVLRAVAEGTTSIAITARDPEGLTASLGFSVTVLEATEANRAPVVIGTAPEQTLDAGDSAKLNASSYFLDPDNDVLTFTAAVLDASVATATVSGTEVVIQALAPGVTVGTITARDPGGLAAAQDFAVTVADSSAPPANVVPCRNGFAGEFPCSGVDLVSLLTLDQIGASGAITNDIWGWTDPVTETEWALVGRSTGTSFINLRDPARPLYTGFLPTSGSGASVWRDIKVYGNHAFIVADQAGPHGMQVFDLTQLRNVQDPPQTFAATTTYHRIVAAHNIVINEGTGFAYSVGGLGGADTCGGGLHMIDIRTPSSPQFVGCFADESTGSDGTGYTHDAMCVVYNGPDTEHRGKEVCFGSNETRLSIADVSDKSNPVALASATYPNVAYSHQGWLDDAHEYLYMNDEFDEFFTGSNTRTLVWDVRDLDDPVVVTQFSHQTSATDHNLYVVGDLMYQSNYLAGLRILSIADRENPVEIAFFDTDPDGDGSAAEGSWSHYRFFGSGVIAVTSMDLGVLFVRLSN